MFFGGPGTSEALGSQVFGLRGPGQGGGGGPTPYSTLIRRDPPVTWPATFPREPPWRGPGFLRLSLHRVVCWIWTALGWCPGRAGAPWITLFARLASWQSQRSLDCLAWRLGNVCAPGIALARCPGSPMSSIAYNVCSLAGVLILPHVRKLSQNLFSPGLQPRWCQTLNCYEFCPLL